MLEMFRVFVLLSLGQSSFFLLIQKMYEVGTHAYSEIVRAYGLARTEFEKILRESGGPYLDHLKVTACLVMVAMYWMGIRDYRVVVAALLHDLIEDIDSWTFDRLVQEFDWKTAFYVQGVSKRPLSEFSGNRAKRDAEFMDRLQASSFFVILIKLCDQTHNLLTLWAKPLSDQRKKIVLAETFYLKLAYEHKIFPRVFRLVILYAKIRLLFTQDTMVAKASS